MFLKVLDKCKQLLRCIKDLSIKAAGGVSVFFRSVGRGITCVCAFVNNKLQAIWHSAFIGEIKYGFLKFGQLFKNAFSCGTKKFVLKRFKSYLCNLCCGVKHCRVTARAFFTLLAPILIFAVLLSSSYSLNGLTLANGVTYGGEYLGTVKNANVLTSAIDILTKTLNVNNPGSYIEPAHLSTNLTNRTMVLDETTLADSMLAHTDSVSSMYGLYVNGVLHAVSETDMYFNRYLSQKLNKYRITGENAVLSFNDDIKIEQNFFPIDAIRTEEQIKTIISDVLQLSVKKAVIEEYEQEEAYKTEEIQSASYSKGYRQVKRYGENGRSKVTASVVYVNGEEVSREVISTEVIKAPVSKQIIVGTKVKQNSTATIPVGGTMLWPVQDVDNVVITSYWGDGRNHKGLDIAAPKGTHIYAAMDGTITHAKWYGGYGYLVKVRHSDSVETWYGHCSGFNVSVGDVVKAGEVIAFVGTTGDSTGNHVHFEVRINGTRVNPAPYLGL